MTNRSTGIFNFRLFFITLCGSIVMFLSESSWAVTDCRNDDLVLHADQVISCYLKLPESIKTPWSLIATETLPDITIETYTLTSQFWPKPDVSQAGRFWQHTLKVYRPHDVQYDDALLVISGGTRYDPGNHQSSSEDFIYSAIAKQTHSVVADLQDTPNQYISFDDGIPRKEDSIIAYSWNRFLDDPVHNNFWPGHIPMTKAAVKAMDALQEITRQSAKPIRQFVLMGASKRGWTTWLAAIHDTRVKAFIPVVIDVLNTREVISHTHDVYQGWPEAWQDYVQQGIPERLNTKAAVQLFKIEDPLSYLTSSEFYPSLLKPKYIITASQDQFFPPDSSQFYFGRLPGEANYLRVVPNQGHNINATVLFPAVSDFYQSILNGDSLPKLAWSVDRTKQLIQITVNQKPQSVKLWQAINPDKRDFRLESGVHYNNETLSGICNETACKYLVDITLPNKGYKAAFVEVTFKKPAGFVLTTPVFIRSASGADDSVSVTN